MDGDNQHLLNCENAIFYYHEFEIEDDHVN